MPESIAITGLDISETMSNCAVLFEEYYVRHESERPPQRISRRRLKADAAALDKLASNEFLEMCYEDFFESGASLTEIAEKYKLGGLRSTRKLQRFVNRRIDEDDEGVFRRAYEVFKNCQIYVNEVCAQFEIQEAPFRLYMKRRRASETQAGRRKASLSLNRRKATNIAKQDRLDALLKAQPETLTAA